MKPTLGRRLVLALLLAFALISLLVIGLNFWTARHQLAEQSVASQLGALLVRSLDELEDEQAARAVLRGFVAEFNRLRQESGLGSGAVTLQLRRRDGTEVFRSGPIEALASHPPPAGLSRIDLAGRPHATFRAEGPRWSLQVLDPLPDDRELLLWLLGQVGISLLVALPVLLLTLWLAVRSGLKPLRRFTERIAALDTRRSLEPLGLDLRYAELQPLTHAFDALLARLREQLALERAFVQDAAHELRTPLAALGAQAHLLLHSPDEPSRQQAAEALQQSLQRTAHLGQQLLDLAALDPVRPRSVAPLDLCELAALVLRQAHGDARRRGVELALEAPDSLPWQGERGALQSLLQNLVDNALRYGARQVELRLQAGADGPCVSVRDDGPGIPPAQQAQMFERFWRGAQSREPGTGLGLAIVAEAAQRLGSELQLGAGLEGRGIGFSLQL